MVGLVLLVGAALIGLALWSAAEPLTFGLCSNTVIRAVDSPDEAYVAVLFARDCGATTGTSTHVSIINDGDQLPNGTGNIVAADLEVPGQAAPWGGPWAEVSWSDANTLTVRHDNLARLSPATRPFAGLRVTLVPAEPRSGAARGDAYPGSLP